MALPDVPVTELFDAPLRRPHNESEEPADDQPPTPIGDFSRNSDYRVYMEACEQRLLQWALAKSNNNISVAAKLLGLPRSTLRSKLEKS